jgi:hypothetical protein
MLFGTITVLSRLFLIFRDEEKKEESTNEEDVII